MPVLQQDFLRLLAQKLQEPASQLLDYGAGLLMPQVDPELRREILARSGEDLGRLLSYLPSDVTDLYSPFAVVKGPLKAARLEALRSRLPETARSFGYSSKTPKLRSREAVEILNILREPEPSAPAYLSYRELRPQALTDWGGVKKLRWSRIKYKDIPLLGWGGEAAAAARRPIPRRDLPPILYHVTARGPKVRQSGLLKGSGVEGGLGGGETATPSPYSGVSFTADRKDALLIQRDLQRTIALARGEARPSDFLKWAEEDARFSQTDPDLLKEAARAAEEHFKMRGRMGRHTGMLEEAVNSYRQGYIPARERVGGPKDPILLGNWWDWAKLDPAEVEIIAVRSRDLPEGALVRSGSDAFLHEVRVHADIPLEGAMFFPKPFSGKP